MLIYTTEDGGFFKSLTDAKGEIRRFSGEEFDELRDTGYLDVTPADEDWRKDREIVRPVFIALAEIVDDHDFLIGGSR